MGPVSTAIQAFSSTDGSAPQAALVAPGDGYLYGTTQYGGANNNGVVFRVLPDGTGYQDLHDFATVDGNGFNSEGINPVAALISIGGGFLAGTASGGGANAFGDRV